MDEVRVQVLSGPPGKLILYELTDISSYQEAGQMALKLLEWFIQRRWSWQVCYTDDADPAEVQEWLQADLLARVMRALVDGRGIRFAGHRWQCRPNDKKDGSRVLEQVTDELAKATYFKVFSDDPEGDLVISYTRPRRPGCP